MQPVYSRILVLLYNCSQIRKSGLNVNSIYNQLVAEKVISRNKKPVIDAIHFLDKGNLILTIKEGKQKEIKVLTPLGNDLARLVIDLKKYSESTSELREALRLKLTNARDHIEYLVSPYEITNVAFIRYISVLSKIKDNKNAKIILNDIMMNVINNQLSEAIDTDVDSENPRDSETSPYSLLLMDKIHNLFTIFSRAYTPNSFRKTDDVLDSLFCVLDVPINNMKEAVYVMRNVYGQPGLGLACQKYLLHKIKENYGLSNLDTSIGLREKYYAKAISETNIPAKIMAGATSDVSLRIREDINGTLLKLLVVDPDNNQLWYPDPAGYEYWNKTTIEYRYESEKQIRVHRRRWTFNIPSNSKAGEYRALILLYKNRLIPNANGNVFDNHEALIIDLEERTFEVVNPEMDGNNVLEGTQNRTQ